MFTETNSLPVHQTLRATTFGPAVERTRLRERIVRIDALLRVSLEISRAVSEARLADSLLDVSWCAERILRRHPSVKCSKEQIEQALEHEGVAARIPMRLARRQKPR